MKIKVLSVVFLHTVLTAFLLIISNPLMANDDPVPLKKGMVITQSVTIKRGVYKLDAPKSMEESLIKVKGNNIVIDFNGAVLIGCEGINRPDEYFGVAVNISEGSNIVLKNAVIKGYKIAVLGRNIHNLTIEHCDLSYNYRQRLNSNRQREDLSDWQSYHNNENDEWIRFGAAIYLRDCDSMIIRDNMVTGGQCALMMTEGFNGLIYNNNFSFNSGIGIGLYRSSYNKVMNNKLDWNIRGVSYGIYYRGQDAAAILVYEQSSHNIFAYNSATHSGDGFFLWAGASTLKTGKGGCNDNLIYGNDFSYAPTNGIEVTFSRNKVINNIIYDCAYGIWAGYSHNTLIQGNIFRDNITGIGIEQGQDNTIRGNSFTNGKTGVRLWATPGRAKEGNYDSKRDVRSMRYLLENNTFSNLETVFSISHSEKMTIKSNLVQYSDEFIRLDSSVKEILIKSNGPNVQIPDKALLTSHFAPEVISGARNAMLPPYHLRGKKYIMMTEWGPYDFRSPILWWTKTDSSGKMYFDILGPSGKWKIKSVEGVENFSTLNGTVPGKLIVNKKQGSIISIELEYTGGDVVSPFGKKYPAGSIYDFGYEKLDLPVIWNMQYFSFEKKTDPIKNPKAFQKMLRTATPLKTAEEKELSLSWWNGIDEKTSDSIAVITKGRVHFPNGSYVIGVSAGDIVRVYVDGKRVINAWDPGDLVYSADYHHKAILELNGWHTIRIEQAQYGGYGMLFLTLKPFEEEE